MPIPCSRCKKECFSELLGTYVLVVIGPTSVIVASLIPNFTSLEALLFVAAVFGSTVGLIILFLGKHSGAVINPAITFGVVFARILHSKNFIPYLSFQIVGGLLAGLTLHELFSSIGSQTSLGSTKLTTGMSPILGVTLEAIGTFILAMSALVASTRLKSARSQATLVGLTLFFLILIIGPLTGAGFNPARSLGPALASGYYQNLAIYFIGPIIGASFAGLLFRVIRDNAAKPRNLVCLC